MFDRKLNQTAKFDIDNAYVLSQFAQLVYAGYTKVEKTCKEWNCGFKWFDNKKTQALIAITKDGNVILSFRGTEPENIGDWVSDIQIKKTKTVKGHIHKGFLKAWIDISAEVCCEIDNLVDDIVRNVWITGHSLGGALAIISALSLQTPLAGIYTFGAPRVGDKKFAKQFDERFKDRTYRLVNNCDIVTRTPPRIGGYKHCGQLIYIDKDDKVHIEEGSLNWWTTFWDRVNGRLENFTHLKLLDGIEDHKLNNYIQALEQA